MNVAALAEIINIGAIIPFLAAIASSDQLLAAPKLAPYLKFFGIESKTQLLLYSAIAFGLITTLTNILRLAVVYANTRLSFSIGAQFSSDMYRKILYQPYAVHLSRNSSESISAIGRATLAANTIMAIMSLIGSAATLVAILIAVFLVNPIISIAIFGGFGSIYALVIASTKKRLQQNSQLLSEESSRAIRVMQEGLGGIRDVLISSAQEVFYKTFLQADTKFRRAEGNIAIIAASPRYLMECIGLVLILLTAYFLTIRQDGGINTAIPILGALALGAQRALPVLQQFYSSYVNISGNKDSLGVALNLLDLKTPSSLARKSIQKLKFKKEIQLKRLEFRYSQSLPLVLEDITLRIRKGDKIGFIGKTGSGKSTLLDIIMGLLHPTAGSLSIDGTDINGINITSWQANIAHVPQSVFLADATIAENIAFGVDPSNISDAMVKIAASKAQISDIIESWPDGYSTIIGERGIRLSGGQRQRIGIARAFYRNADVLVFDEATSALDSETENSVMSAIDSIDAKTTVLIIAHRLSTLKNCQKIIELVDGRISEVKNIT
jgi:ABC-type multidrug transport system fused ATPase/permease subunit